MSKMTMIYWQEGAFWVGKLKDHPEIMSQGLSLEELEENIRDAYSCMVMEDVPDNYGTKEIAL
jgi:predicted RNase H-like HicB family nuclease